MAGKQMMQKYGYPVAGLIIAFILKRFVYTEQVDSFVMELPTYKMPSYDR